VPWFASLRDRVEPKYLGSAHSTPEKYVNSVVTLKTHQMFSVHDTPKEFKNATITGHFGFVLEEKSLREITRLAFRHPFSKSSVKNVFRPHENTKPTFSNSSGLKSVFQKLGFRDGSLWTVGLTKFLWRQCGR